MQVQQIAEFFNDTSHRVRMACQNLKIPLNEVDSISDLDWDKYQADIHNYILSEQKKWKERKNG